MIITPTIKPVSYTHLLFAGFTKHSQLLPSIFLSSSTSIIAPVSSFSPINLCLLYTSVIIRYKIAYCILWEQFTEFTI